MTQFLNIALSISLHFNNMSKDHAIVWLILFTHFICLVDPSPDPSLLHFMFILIVVFINFRYIQMHI